MRKIIQIAKCIHGEPSQKQLREDADLGKCVRTGCRNTVRNEGDADRTFGCPSIRTDIPFKQKKSIADPHVKCIYDIKFQNYGDEPQANQLLYPRGFWQIGVSEEDFMLLRTRDELKELFDKIGFQYKVGKFNTMFNKACLVGKIQKWFKKEGDQIVEGDVLCDVVTDKATVAFQYQDQGYLAKILHPDGAEQIKVGDMVAVVVPQAETVKDFKDYKIAQQQAISAPPSPPPAEAATATQEQKKVSSPSQPSSTRKFASPLAKATAQSQGVDINQIQGSGPKGRVINADVKQFKPVSKSVPVEAGEFNDIELSNVRKVIAGRLTASKTQIPHYYVSIDCNMDNLLKQAQKIAKLFKLDQEGDSIKWQNRSYQ